MSLKCAVIVNNVHIYYLCFPICKQKLAFFQQIILNNSMVIHEISHKFQLVLQYCQTLFIKILQLGHPEAGCYQTGIC